MVDAMHLKEPEGLVGVSVVSKMTAYKCSRDIVHRLTMLTFMSDSFTKVRAKYPRMAFPAI